MTALSELMVGFSQYQYDLISILKNDLFETINETVTSVFDLRDLQQLELLTLHVVLTA